jgi:carotenoid cleavage dioxygenase-like enzyme
MLWHISRPRVIHNSSQGGFVTIKLEKEFSSLLPEDDSHPYRTGAWRPQHKEWTATNMEVRGQIPADLNGVYLRNTENPLMPSLERYHPFDGDGMIHAISFREGNAEYRNRFVRTKGLAIEIEAGSAQWSGLAESPLKSPRQDGWGARTRMKDASSTDVIVHNGVALTSFYQCGDLYQLNPVTLDDLGPATWNGKFPEAGVSAHSKVDEHTGELLFFNYQTSYPYMHYGVLSPTGELAHYTPVPLPGPRLPHDMAFTTNYSILNDCPLFWREDLLQRDIYATQFHPDMPTRLGVIPRYGTEKDVKWFECEATYVLHWINAYEEGDEIVVDGYFEFDPSPTMGPEVTPEQRMFRYLDLFAMQSKPYRWRLNMKTGAVKEGLLSNTITEFGMINGRIAGKKYDWVYSVVPAEGWFGFEGLIKHNVSTGSEETYLLPTGTYASETVFAPRPNATSEDDGYLITFTIDVVNDVSDCQIFDAKNLSDGPIASIRLPERISSGTHAYWTDASALTPLG